MNLKQCQELMKGCKKTCHNDDGDYYTCEDFFLCSSCQATRIALLNEKKEMLEFLKPILTSPSCISSTYICIKDKIKEFEEEIKELENGNK